MADCAQRRGPRPLGVARGEQVGNQGGRHSGHRRTTGFGGAGRRGIDYKLSKVVGAFHPVSLAAFAGVDGVGSAQGVR